jgi:ADP-ribosyltransferase exoenzyme
MAPSLPQGGDGEPRAAEPGRAPGLSERVELLDRALGARPVPEDVVAWRALAEGAFETPWRELAGTLHQERGYLAVALVRYEELATATALLQLRIPRGTPAMYLNALDERGVLPAPTLLLGRGLYLYVRNLRRQDGQWYVSAEILPTGGREPGPLSDPG